MKKWWIPLALLLLAVIAMGWAGDSNYWRQYAAAALGQDIEQQARAVAPRWRIAGTDAAVPRASADAESIATEALAAATAFASARASRALIVQRHGHRVHEYFAQGVSDHTEVVGGELAPALMALALASSVERRKLATDEAVRLLRAATAPAQQAAPRNPWSAAARRYWALAPAPSFVLQDADADLATLLSQRVWLPLQARDAWLWGESDQAVRPDCCVVAQLADWVRVGELLADFGNYQGSRVIAADWVRTLLAADAQGRWHPVWLNAQREWSGAEPPAARDAQWFDLGAGLRLWLVPRRQLAVLHWSGASDATDTELLNIILRGLTDQLPNAPGQSTLNDLVPGH